MRIYTTVEQFNEVCPEDAVMDGWLEETSVYVSVAAVDDGDMDDPPAEV